MIVLRHTRNSYEQSVQLYLRPSSLPRRLRTHCSKVLIHLEEKQTGCYALFPANRRYRSPSPGTRQGYLSLGLGRACHPHPAIVRTLWIALISSLLQPRFRSLLACRRAARRPALPLSLLFLAKTFGTFIYLYFLYVHVSSNSCPRSRLRFRSREKDSALPPGVESLILHARAGCGDC